MEFILTTKLYMLPGTDKSIEISYPVDLKILDENEFLEICYLNNNECTDNVWYSQFINKFGTEFKEYKPSNYTWSQYYLWLNDWLNNSTFEQFNQTDREDLKLLWLLFKSRCNIDGANWAAQNGYLNVLKWLSQRNPPILPDLNGANQASSNNHLDIIKWLSRLNPPILPNEKGATLAVVNGHLDMLKWLTQRYPPILPLSFSGDSAAENGHVDILEYLAHLDNPILPGKSTANVAASNGHLKVLEWLSQRNPPILPNVSGANEAAKNKHFDVLKWLAGRNPPILPNMETDNTPVNIQDLEGIYSLPTRTRSYDRDEYDI